MGSTATRTSGDDWKVIGATGGQRSVDDSVADLRMAALTPSRATIEPAGAACIGSSAVPISMYTPRTVTRGGGAAPPPSASGRCGS